MKQIFVPFDLPEYFNGAHPLVNNFTDKDTADFYFSRTGPLSCVKNINKGVATLADELFETCESLNSDKSSLLGHIHAFILSRRLDIQLQVPKSVDLVYHHTVPYSINQRDFILHIETISQIFQPFIKQGYDLGHSLLDSYAFHFVKFLLESKKCKQIFTNLSFTIDQLKSVFKSKEINKKIRYVSPSYCMNIENITKLSKRRVINKNLNILFTNSYHDEANSFYLRGGLDLIICVLELSSTLSNIKLTIRSSVPNDLRKSNLWNDIVSCPNIRWLEKKITDAELMNIYVESDIFYLHSNSLHSLSILRGMALGLTCFVSDVPGVEEYITNNFNGIQFKGQRDLVCKIDESTGWVYDDYSPHLNRKHIKGINFLEQKHLLAQLACNKDVLDYLGSNAIKTAREKFSEESSQAQFRKMILEI